MTPQQARAALDRGLLQAGQDCILQRLGPAPALTPISVTVRAHVTDYRPQELLGGNGLQAGDSRVIMSTTQIDAAAWPSVSESPLPRKGDRLIVSGRTRSVLAAWEAPRINGALVRIELSIR